MARMMREYPVDWLAGERESSGGSTDQVGIEEEDVLSQFGSGVFRWDGLAIGGFCAGHFDGKIYVRP
jgi:hypothetical protein